MPSSRSGIVSRPSSVGALAFAWGFWVTMGCLTAVTIVTFGSGILLHVLGVW